MIACAMAHNPARALHTTVQEKGTDIFRSKGILCLKGSSDK